MASVTYAPSSNISTLTNLNNEPFFTTFDIPKDVLTNKSKLYLQEIFSTNYKALMGICSGSIYTSSNASSQIIITAFTDSATGAYYYKSIQSLLRNYNADMTSAWIPVSSSLFNRTATNITIISFANNIIGDRLSLYSTEKLQFHIIMSGIDLYAQSASKFSGYTYDLNPSYTQYTSNFGFLFTSSTDLTMNQLNFKGLIFGELGLIMLYSASAIAINDIICNNVIKQQRLNSKTYFCRITNDKYNATTNPTWYTYSSTLGANIIRGDASNSFTVITTIGLYNDNNELLAIAKLSQPVLKQVDTELHAKVVLQY